MIRQFETFGRRPVPAPATSSKHVVFDDHDHVFESSTDPEEVDFEDSLNQPPDSLYDPQQKMSFASSSSDKDSDTESFESILLNKASTIDEKNIPNVEILKDSNPNSGPQLLEIGCENPTSNSIDDVQDVPKEIEARLGNREDVELILDRIPISGSTPAESSDVISPKQTKVRFAKPIELEIGHVSSDDESADESGEVLANVQLEEDGGATQEPKEFDGTCLAQPIESVSEEEEATDEEVEKTNVVDWTSEQLSSGQGYSSSSTTSSSDVYESDCSDSSNESSSSDLEESRKHHFLIVISHDQILHLFYSLIFKNSHLIPLSQPQPNQPHQSLLKQKHHIQFCPRQQENCLHKIEIIEYPTTISNSHRGPRRRGNCNHTIKLKTT